MRNYPDLVYQPTTNGRRGGGVSTVTVLVAVLALGLLIIQVVFVVSYFGGTRQQGPDNGVDDDVGGGTEPNAQPSTRNGDSGRFSLAKARAGIRPSAHDELATEDFKAYKFDFAGTTGVHTGWDTDDRALRKMCEMLTVGLRYVHHHPGGGATKAVDARLLLAVTENFIMRYKLKIDAVKAKKPEGVPWGADAKAFCVESACMLAHYLLLPPGYGDAAMKREAIDLILALIESPSKAFGLTTTERCSILRMVGPWILAKYLKGEGDAAADSAEYKTAVAHANVVVRHGRSEKGTHMDHSFYERNLGAFYAYLGSLCDDKLLYYYGFDTRVTSTPVPEWDAVRRIMLHPTVRYGNAGMFGRGRTLKYDSYDKSKYGVEVMPFSGYLRYFTKGRQFSVRAQMTHLACYESDATFDDMAQYWVQYRNVHSADAAYPVTFPDVGFINKAGQTQRTVLPAPAAGSETVAYMPTKAKSFVAAYKRFGVMYQEYEIKEFGRFAVSELIVVNTATKVVDVKLKIVNADTAVELDYYGANKTKYVVPANGTKAYTTTINMESGAMQTAELAEFPGFPYTLDTGVVIKDVPVLKAYVLYEGKTPIIWAPYGWSYEMPNLVYNLGGVHEMFTFDAKENQYINAKHAARGGGVPSR